MTVPDHQRRHQRLVVVEPATRLRCSLAVMLLVAMGWVSGTPAQPRPDLPLSDYRITVDDVRFGPGLRRPARVVHGSTGEPLARELRCRWVPAHTDVGLTALSPNGCSVEFHVDPRRTRRSRFELDPWMGVDVIVRRGDKRVGFASTRLRFVE